MTTNLVIQAGDIETQDLKNLYGIAQAKGADGRGIEKIDGDRYFLHQAFRILNANPATNEDVRRYCEDHKLDFGFVADQAKLSDLGLIAMDMDSTLITIECIDEIADFTGRKAEVAAVTEAAMRGEIDWPTSLRQRVAMLKGLSENVLDQVYQQRLHLSAGAEQLIAAAKRDNIKLLLVSGGFTFFTDKLKARLGLDYAFSNTLEIENGVLTGRVLGDLCDARAKAAHVRNTASVLGLEPSQIIAIGDGANDLLMMQASGTSIAFHAKPVVRAQARYSLSHVGLDGVLGLFAVGS